MDQPDFLNPIGNPNETHPIPIRLRNCNVSKKMGGSFGYRGAGYGKARKRVLWLAQNRSTATGLDATKATLEVDHIQPYRLGGVGPMTNTPLNLRVLDTQNNPAMDAAQTFKERPRRRKLRTF